MAPIKALACFSIYLALNIVSSRAWKYTVIDTALASRVWKDAGYTEEDYVQRWQAEGKAIFKALNYISGIVADTNNVEEEEERIEFIVASTGGNSCSYIYGEAERLKQTLTIDKKPSKIIVVYTLNYVNSASAVNEHSAFQEALKVLIIAGAGQKPPIKVDVRQFRPVLKNKSTLVEKFDYQEFDNTEMNTEQLEAQQKIIDDLNKKVQQDNYISSDDFKRLLNIPNIKVIVDCVVISGMNEVNGKNQLLRAIPMAQIQIMATAIQEKKRGDGVFVICIDNPSGMDESGIWTIHSNYVYSVDVILSCVWNKPLVNSMVLKGGPIVLVLDIEYKGTRLFDKLLKRISDLHLVQDVKTATIKAKSGVIKFEANGAKEEVLRMLVV